MFISRFSFDVGARFNAPKRYLCLCLTICLLLSSFLLMSCSGVSLGGGGSTPTAKPTPSQLALARLHWCNKPFILFRDEHAPVTGTGVINHAPTTATVSGTPGSTATTTAGSTPTATVSPTTGGTPTTLTNWSQIKPNLGFTVYLPATLPNNTCLVSASGTLNDPIFGGNFIIGYLLPDKSPISLSEAPLRTNSRDFQCTSPKGEASHVSTSVSPSTSVINHAPTPALTPSPTVVPTLLCTGVKDNTSIVFSGRGDETSLKKFFDALKPNVAWVPAS